MTFSATWRRTGELANFIVPSGNLGNVLACVWARRMGLPIGDIVLAFNANRTVPDYLGSGEWRPRASVPTLASAMDVGNPSNMERLRHLHPSWSELAAAVSSVTVTDDEIRNRIRSDRAQLGQTWCPHTATAAEAYARPGYCSRILFCLALRPRCRVYSYSHPSLCPAAPTPGTSNSNSTVR